MSNEKLWEPINDLPTDWKELADESLPALVTVWKEQVNRLKESGNFQPYLDRLVREIAIETGIIERLYTIDRGITRLLIERGIDEALIAHGSTDQPVKKVVSMIRDQQEAIEGLFDFVGGTYPLTAHYIRSLHQTLTRHQKTTEALDQFGNLMNVRLSRGTWKTQPNNPTRDDGMIHYYAPPEQVQSEMDKLIEWHRQHEEKNVSPELSAAWLHHRFTQIHPFQDGNGRVARCLASLVFIKAGWFPLVLTRDNRTAYIDALELADDGDLSALVSMFAKSQRQAFIRSLSLSDQVLSDKRQARAVIANIAEKFRRPERTAEQKIATVENYAERLLKIVKGRLDDVSTDIKLSLQNLVLNPHIFVTDATADSEQSHYYRYQVIESAKQLDYYANLRSYHSWTQLTLDVERPTMILFSFHVIGYTHSGILACSACAYHRDDMENGERTVSEIQVLIDEPFQFSYGDNEQNLVKRFREWMETALVSGLDYWNSGL